MAEVPRFDHLPPSYKDVVPDQEALSIQRLEDNLAEVEAKLPDVSGLRALVRLFKLCVRWPPQGEKCMPCTPRLTRPRFCQEAHHEQEYAVPTGVAQRLVSAALSDTCFLYADAKLQQSLFRHTASLLRSMAISKVWVRCKTRCPRRPVGVADCVS